MRFDGVLYRSVFVLSLLESGYGKIPLHILSLQELTNIPVWYDINTLMPAIVESTLERINNHTSLLQDYELRVIHGDIQVFVDVLSYMDNVIKKALILLTLSSRR